ncbi:MAG: type IV pilin N-terminal domain-containing protein [Halohasta sp.]
MTDSSRGQSEVVGTVLLAGIVVLAISIFGVMALNSIDYEERQLTDVSVAVTTENVTVAHAGGEPIAAGNLVAVISFEGDRERYSAADAGVSDPVRTGDEWVIDSGLPYGAADRGEFVSVRVIAVNTNEVLYDEVEEIE